MPGLDPVKTREHRRQQAGLGFPLLRGSPNTAAIGLINFLDQLSADEQLSFANQLSDLADAQLTDPGMVVEARDALMRSLPLVERYFGRQLGLTSTHVPTIDVRLMPVKVLAGVLRDELAGGFDGWTKLVKLSEEPLARMPPAHHATSLQEIDPVAPARLRKLIGDGMKKRFGAAAQRVASDHSQFTAQTPNGSLKVDVRFATGVHSRPQFDYSVNAKIEDRPPLWMASYESVWLTSAQWDYVTEINADRSVAHLIRQIETCLELN